MIKKNRKVKISLFKVMMTHLMDEEGAVGAAKKVRGDDWAEYDWPPVIEQVRTEYHGSKIQGMYTGNLEIPEDLEPVTLNYMMCLMTRCMTRLCNEFGSSFDGFYQDTAAHTYYYTVNIPDVSGSKESWTTAKESLNTSNIATIPKVQPQDLPFKEPKPSAIDRITPKITIIKKSSKKQSAPIPKVNLPKKSVEKEKPALSKQAGFF